MYKYQSGFGGHFATEALEGVLPIGQNSPQNVNLGLFAEQFSATAFTMPRHKNIRTWMYRINPSVKMGTFMKTLPKNYWQTAPISSITPPNAMRWNKLDKLTESLERVVMR